MPSVICGTILTLWALSVGGDTKYPGSRTAHQGFATSTNVPQKLIVSQGYQFSSVLPEIAALPRGTRRKMQLSQRRAQAAARPITARTPIALLYDAEAARSYDGSLMQVSVSLAGGSWWSR